MTKATTPFRALVVRECGDGTFKRSVEERRIDDLPAGEVLVRVDFSSLNYKDALSATGNRGVTKRFPHTPGIDAAGVVVDSAVPECTPGQEVVVSGYDLGMNTPGGFGRYIRVPSSWVMPKPESLTPETVMKVGTAGFTAAQCVVTLEEYGVAPDHGPVLVSGATGGVGCVAVALLKQHGYSVAVVTGKKQEHDWLRNLGADEFLDREQASRGTDKMLLRERWAGAVDTVGGQILAATVKATRYNGAVACCGNAASGELPLSVYPFILRAVKLVGIDSAQCPMERRKEIWHRLMTGWDLGFLDSISTTISLDELSDAIERMLQGGIRGRIVVDMREEK
ncbi:MAG: YhdH/YhfP family quinone oxidoreductase [Desulfobulbaceae bacterium]